MKTMKVNIQGMSCKACSTKVEKGLKELEGVHNAKVDLANDSAHITFDSNKVSEKEIETKIEEVGYSIKGKKGNNNNETKKTLMQGIAYGLIPHIGCIGFIVASILGVTFAAELFRPLLLNPLFFYGLIVLSLVFATISSVIYLKKNDLLSINGIKKKTNYLLVMYTTTIGVSLLFLFVIFPMLVTNLPATDAQTTQNLSAGTSNGESNSPIQLNTEQTNTIGTFKLEVQIPCAGHSPLIVSELKKLEGVTSAKMLQWNTFSVTFDTAKTTKEKILTAEIFFNYPAKVMN